MPVYEYECETCGVFSALRKMSESNAPAFCGECGGESPRIMSAPRLAVLDRTQRVAHERNEKSAHDPKVARRSSCGCTGSHTWRHTGAAGAGLPGRWRRSGFGGMSCCCWWRREVSKLKKLLFLRRPLPRFSWQRAERSWLLLLLQLLLLQKKGIRQD